MQNAPTIQPEHIHLWLCKPSTITDPTLLQQYHDLLNEEETQRYERFHFEKDRHRHLITRALTRSTLSHYIPEIDPRNWRFKHNDFGKPKIANHLSSPLAFNISHSSDYIIIAITKGRQVGVDVEYIRQRNNIEGLADYCFNEEEKKYIFANEGTQTLERFFQLWTLKESYIKAYGKGLSISLKDIQFNIHSGCIDIEFQGKHDDNPKQWQFYSSKLTNDYQLAVTLQQVEVISPSQLRIIECTPLFECVEHKTLP